MVFGFVVILPTSDLNSFLQACLSRTLVCSDLVIVFNQSWASDRVPQGLLLVSFKKSLSLWLDSDRRLSNLLVSISENLVSEVFMPTMRISLLMARVSRYP